jgi:hypothetical protein
MRGKPIKLLYRTLYWYSYSHVKNWRLSFCCLFESCFTRMALWLLKAVTLQINQLLSRIELWLIQKIILLFGTKNITLPSMVESQVAQSVQCLAVGWTIGWSRFLIPGRGERIFPVASVSRLALGPTQPPALGVLYLGLKHSRGMILTTHPHLVQERVGAIPPLPPSMFVACRGTALAFSHWWLLLYIKIQIIGATWLIINRATSISILTISTQLPSTRQQTEELGLKWSWKSDSQKSMTTVSYEWSVKQSAFLTVILRSIIHAFLEQFHNALPPGVCVCDKKLSLNDMS